MPLSPRDLAYLFDMLEASEKVQRYLKNKTLNWIDMIDELKEIFGREVDLVEASGLRNPF